MGTGSPMRARTWATVAAAPYCSAEDAARVGSFSSSERPADESASTRKPPSTSVSARSKPPVTSGPVPIEVQKQVLADVVHWTATVSTRWRRRA